jgi:hypothetical protein
MFKEKFEFLKEQKKLQEAQAETLAQRKIEFLWMNAQQLLDWTLHIHYMGYKKNHLGLCYLPFLSNDISEDKMFSDAKAHVELDGKHLQLFPLSLRDVELSVDDNMKLTIVGTMYEDASGKVFKRNFASLEEVLDLLSGLTLDECEIISFES